MSDEERRLGDDIEEQGKKSKDAGEKAYHGGKDAVNTGRDAYKRFKNHKGNVPSSKAGATSGNPAAGGTTAGGNLGAEAGSAASASEGGLAGAGAGAGEGSAASMAASGGGAAAGGTGGASTGSTGVAVGSAGVGTAGAGAGAGAAAGSAGAAGAGGGAAAGGAAAGGAGGAAGGSAGAAGAGAGLVSNPVGWVILIILAILLLIMIFTSGMSNVQSEEVTKQTPLFAKGYKTTINITIKTGEDSKEKTTKEERNQVIWVKNVAKIRTALMLKWVKSLVPDTLPDVDIIKGMSELKLPPGVSIDDIDVATSLVNVQRVDQEYALVPQKGSEEKPLSTDELIIELFKLAREGEMESSLDLDGNNQYSDEVLKLLDRMSISASEQRLLSAYSVSVDNLNHMQMNKDTTILGEKYKYTGTGSVIINQNGEIQNVNEDNKINYQEDFKEKINKYIDEGNSFYELTFEKNGDGTTKVYTIKTTDKNRKEQTIKYVIPIIKERNIGVIAEEIFGLDPKASYINDKNVTNQEAINTLTLTTMSLLFDTDLGGISSTGEIILSELAGKFEYPAPGFFTITSSYGDRIPPVKGVSSFHSGIDIGTPMGSNIVAAEEGTVTKAELCGVYGYLVSIKHDNGFTTHYAHLSEFRCQKGQRVKKGEVIALSGGAAGLVSSGASTGPHLHFEIVTPQGNAVDPLPYVVSEDNLDKMNITG